MTLPLGKVAPGNMREFSARKTACKHSNNLLNVYVRGGRINLGTFKIASLILRKRERLSKTLLPRRGLKRVPTSSIRTMSRELNDYLD